MVETSEPLYSWAIELSQICRGTSTDSVIEIEVKSLHLPTCKKLHMQMQVQMQMQCRHLIAVQMRLCCMLEEAFTRCWPERIRSLENPQVGLMRIELNDQS